MALYEASFFNSVKRQRGLACGAARSLFKPALLDGKGGYRYTVSSLNELPKDTRGQRRGC
ncbi:MAG: hypothetical protein DMG37_08205 [Acidobacteria bacterium]|nr:MAG: hypothetical protein DMG37_08205 [Acidobacteriota bacterium]